MVNLSSINWPGDAQCAAALTFDFDAESSWLANGERHHEMPAILSLGKYGARVGVPKILELLEEEGLPATFFIPGWTAERYPDLVRLIAASGYEIGHHGYTHDPPDPIDPAMVEDEIMRGLEALEKVAGVRPVGYRAPDGVASEISLQILKREGFLYSSNFKDHYLPYRHTLSDGSEGIIEIPEQPTLDDWSYGASSLQNPRPLFTKAHVLSIWQDEFRELYDWGAAFTLVMHPQVTGRPMRLATLREFIAFTRTFDRVWYATCREIAEAYLEATGHPATS
jgi:peptidoglycan/xylan/chitin deacetylase (PgdA/CDA1 family)